ncbi:MAG: adenine deaminase [Spirosomataceae bacterium]
MQQISANYVNIFDNSISYATIKIANGRIQHVDFLGDEKPGETYFTPPFVDAHIHIESSMLTPAQFARMAVVHGTVGTVSDPHEIANVLGIDGVKYMIEDGKRVPFKFCFGAPSCVPATTFETAGAEITAADIKELLAMKEVGYLAEMMNFPGVLFDDPIIIEKLTIAKEFNKPIDGHAPGLRGDDAKKYIEAGISTDHECFTYDEALEKLQLGMKIIIREGSAAKNFEALIPLAKEYADEMMFCSDDKHPDSLEIGHINVLVKRAIAAGVNMFDALRMASLNPVLHYRLNVGLLREGEPADFVIVDNLTDFNVLQTYIDGECVAENGVSKTESLTSGIVNNFNCSPISIKQIELLETPTLPVIQEIDEQVITNRINFSSLGKNGKVVSDTERDILKIIVVNRYNDAPPAIAFIHNFGIKEGAIASSVAHDSHNVIAVGVSDEDIVEAVNLIIENKGGVSAVSSELRAILPLPIAGLMSNEDGYKVAKDYTDIDKFAKEQLGCTLSAPFMSLSFMGLLVIPKLKLSDKGLFDGEKFEFV